MLICFPANLIYNLISKASLARITVALLAYEAKSIISIITAFVFLFDLAAVENNIWKLFEHFSTQEKGKNYVPKNISFIWYLLNNILQLFKLLMSADQRVGRVASAAEISV